MTPQLATGHPSTNASFERGSDIFKAAMRDWWS